MRLRGGGPVHPLLIYIQGWHPANKLLLKDVCGVGHPNQRVDTRHPNLLCATGKNYKYVYILTIIRLTRNNTITTRHTKMNNEKHKNIYKTHNNNYTTHNNKQQETQLKLRSQDSNQNGLHQSQTTPLSRPLIQ